MPIVTDLELGGPSVALGSISIQLRDHPVAQTCSIHFDQRVHGLDTFVYSGPTEGWCNLRVRHDAAHAIMVVEQYSTERSWRVLSIHETRHGAVIGRDARALHGALRIPAQWASFAAFSAAGALALLLVASRHRRRAAAMASLADGEKPDLGIYRTAAASMAGPTCALTEEAMKRARRVVGRCEVIAVAAAALGALPAGIFLVALILQGP